MYLSLEWRRQRQYRENEIKENKIILVKRVSNDCTVNCNYRWFENSRLYVSFRICSLSNRADFKVVLVFFFSILNSFFFFFSSFSVFWKWHFNWRDGEVNGWRPAKGIERFSILDAYGLCCYVHARLIGIIKSIDCNELNAICGQRHWTLKTEHCEQPMNNDTIN